jgi:hypothetical protein
MKFYDYKTLYHMVPATVKDGFKGIEDFYGAAKSIANQKRIVTEIVALSSELIWFRNNRPYYKVWPSVIPAFLKLKFTVPVDAMSLPSPVVCLRLTEQSLPDFPDCESILVSLYQQPAFPDDNARQFSLGIQCSKDRFGRPTERGKFLGLVFKHGESLEDALSRAIHPPTVYYENKEAVPYVGDGVLEGSDRKEMESAVRLACSVCLLATDPTIIEPDVLADDRRRFDESTDPTERQRLIDKAKRRGIVGWRIGEKYEVCPHYRRPHFALRHTGKGGTVPRIVPVKGAVVHRKKITDVPTGYLTPEGEEIES